MRCLVGFLSTAPQVSGILIVTDMYPFHLQARMINLWSAGFLVSPYISPWLFGYLAAKINYRWAYGITCFYALLVVVLIALLGEETAYDRYLPLSSPSREISKSKLETLIGITGYRMSKYNCSWKQAIMPTLKLLTKPHCLAILLYLGVAFGFAIGVNVTNVIFAGSPPPFGYGFSEYVVASLYATPVVAVIMGELLGRYLNDKTASFLTNRNHGVFEPEMRLWTLYCGIILDVAGFLILGGAFQKKWNVVAVVFGWGLSVIAIMIGTVACTNYLNNSFFFPGEISGLLNLARVLGGFAVPYFQVTWAERKGPFETFACEAAIMAGLFLFTIPLLQIKGSTFRTKYTLRPEVHNYCKPAAPDTESEK